MTKISIVIPAYNEAENIGPLISEIVHLNLEYPFEIIIVDDASSDNTYANVVSMKQDVQELRIIQHKNTSGQSASIATGIEYATGELIVTMDGDGQNNPADIPNMVAALITSKNTKLCMVAGFRKKRDDSSWRIIS